jgi:hypothetical protein
VTTQLTQARRIASLRERRSERERRDAALRLRQQMAEADAAQSQLHRRAAERAEAERMLIADPADPQAQLWRMLSCEQEQGAARLAAEAEDLLITEQGSARAAQFAHDRNIQRGQLLDERIAAAVLGAAGRAEERDADELQGRRS